MKRPPNILCIMTDEHDPAVTGCYGDPLVQTPHLDGLAQRGVTFDACYCNSPLCAPSRLSFTASQYISRFGGWNNQCWLPSDDYPSLMHSLNAAGYDTYLCGKQHYDASRRYGFTRDLWPEHNSHIKSGPTGGRREPRNRKPNINSWNSRSAQFVIRDYEKTADTGVTFTARGFLGTRRRSDKPFFLFAGYHSPHFPLRVRQRYADRYLGKTPPPIGRPDWQPVDDSAMPVNYQQHRLSFGNTEADPETERLGRDLYWALTNEVDDEIGKLLTALQQSEVAEDTIVIYTSDHGENKGDHGLWWKNCMFDHGARVPLIVSYPQRWTGGQRRAQVCSLVDVVQTIIALGGGEADPQMDGASLLPVLDDPDADWHDQAVSEYYGSLCSGISMLREGRWKYVYHATIDEEFPAERELYDMAADPQELCNLAGSSDTELQTRIEHMHHELVRHLGEEPDAIEQRYRASKPYDRPDTTG